MSRTAWCGAVQRGGRKRTDTDGRIRDSDARSRGVEAAVGGGGGGLQLERSGALEAPVPRVD